MATADLTVIGLGRVEAGASGYLAEIRRRLDGQERVGFRMHAMGTSLEGSVDDILALVAELHAVPLELGLPRAYSVGSAKSRDHAGKTFGRRTGCNFPFNPTSSYRKLSLKSAEDEHLALGRREVVSHGELLARVLVADGDVLGPLLELLLDLRERPARLDLGAVVVGLVLEGQRQDPLGHQVAAVDAREGLGEHRLDPELERRQRGVLA